MAVYFLPGFLVTLFQFIYNHTMALPVFFDGLSSIASSSDNMISSATGCELAKTRTLPTQF